MTRAEFEAMYVHPDWIDGRRGCLWPRLDAILDKPRGLRAELTWDDAERDPRSDVVRPHLLLETNELEPDGNWRTLDSYVLEVSEETAIAMAGEAPARLLQREEVATAAAGLHPGCVLAW